MPAMRAVPTTSPLGASPRATAAAVSGSSMCVSSSGRLVNPLRRGDEVAHRLLVAVAEQLDRIGVAVHDRLEEDLAVLVGGQCALCPAAHLVEQHGKACVGLAVLVGDLVADALG